MNITAPAIVGGSLNTLIMEFPLQTRVARAVAAKTTALSLARPPPRQLATTAILIMHMTFVMSMGIVKGMTVI